MAIAERPVLVVGPDGDAARILEEAGWGISVPPTPAALAAALDTMLAGGPPLPARSGADSFAYPRVAERMAEQIEHAIAHRRGR